VQQQQEVIDVTIGSEDDEDMGEVCSCVGRRKLNRSVRCVRSSSKPQSMTVKT
jgi:hypothetical protein